MNVDLAFVSAIPDRDAFHALLLDYYATVFPILRNAGGPDLSPREYADATLAEPAALLPPENRLILGHTPGGALVACATLRRMSPEAVEMKRMFVRPEVRGQGLGTRLFEMRVAEARRMGCKAVYADTVRGNRPMLSIYERFGFRYVPRYEGNANPPEMADHLVYLEYRLDDARP